MKGWCFNETSFIDFISGCDQFFPPSWHSKLDLISNEILMNKSGLRNKYFACVYNLYNLLQKENNQKRISE